MGLDVSHDAFHGAYSSFNRLRQFVCAATGGSFPPHSIRTDLDNNYFQCGEGYNTESHPGLFEFLSHSDCDGDISPTMCIKVADDLEELLPKMKKLPQESWGHIARDGGYIMVVEQFIRGCREAAAKNEPLEFA